METLLPHNPSLALPLFPEKTPTLLFRRAHCYGYSHPKPFLRGSLSVARFGFKPEFLPDPENTEGVFKELFGRAESFLYTIADAAVSSSASETVTTTKQNSDWLSGITNYMETVLKVLKGGLSAVHVPYAYGFAIILLTVLVKAATFPLTKKQVESAMSMRSLQPQIKAIQQRYAGDQERIQLETARLYKLAGINPFAGCLPTLVTIPIWIGLYRALSNVADEGLLKEGFFWIPSLAGPTTVAARQNGSGISWLFPFVDGHPPLGWSDTLAYLVLPILLIASQYISIQIMQSSQKNDPNMKSSQVLTNVLPLMIGYFALSVPSGLSLYWFTNNILSSAQQIWLQKLGGATAPMGKLNDEIIEGDQSQVQKSLSQMISPQKESSKGEKLTLDGPQPGARFKQLKEQEARKRQQREEEKRRAEKTAAKSAEITNGRHDNKDTVLERENGAGVKLVVEKNEGYNSQSATHNSSNGGVTVNGELSIQDSKQDQNTSSVFQMADVEVSTTSNVVGTVEQQSYESQEKVLESIKVYTSTAGSDDKISEEDAREVGRD